MVFDSELLKRLRLGVSDDRKHLVIRSAAGRGEIIEYSFGIEEEYFLVDKTTRDVVGEPPGDMLAECEALLGAIFLEAGYEKAREVIRTHWTGRLEITPAEAADAKSALQEWAQGQGLDLPQYVEVARQGPDHAPRFTSEVRIKGTKPARGEGASKRAAEQAAAHALLAREGVARPR